MPFAATWMDLEIHTKWSKSHRERQISHDFAYMWNLKKWYKWTYSQNRNRLTVLENKLMVTGGVGIDWEFGINMYTLLYLK